MSYIGNQPSNMSFLSDTFSGNGSTTVFTMAVAPANTAAVLVAIWGVLQDPTTYGVVGRILTFSQAPPTGIGNISVRYLALPASNITTTAYRSVTEFTATAGQTTFTPASYTPGFIDVFRSGVRLGTSNYTATNGVTVTLNNPAAAGDLISIESFFVSSVLNAIPNVSGAISPALLDISGQVGTGAIQIPSGTTAQRPASPTVGMIRFNTTLNYIEEFRQGQWLALSSVFSASGGSVSTYNAAGINYRVHVFNSSDTFIVSSGSSTVDYLVIAGGGGGGCDRAGGGGAGGYLAGTATVSPGSYSVIVGGGGAGATGDTQKGVNGGNSVFGTFATAIGGGGGGSENNPTGVGGGSGGGAGYTGGAAGGAGTAGQGNAGGTAQASPRAPGGGGGAGQAGQNGSAATMGGGAGARGGNGLSSSITGVAVVRGGGGGAGSNIDGTGGPGFGAGGDGGGGNGGVTWSASPNGAPGNGSPGTANTGGGGGGGTTADSGAGGQGGSGVVIIRYQI
jgi:hypothetical protein